MKLKPCPFCGEKAEYSFDAKWSDKHVIECSYCGCERRYEYSKIGAIDAWNRRPAESALAEALGKIQRRLHAGSLDEWSIKALEDIAKQALAPTE